TLWTVQSPEAFETPEYKADWGFLEWAQYVTAWSRDLFDGRFAPDAALAVSLKGSLRVVSCDGMSADDARAAAAVLANSSPERLWLPATALDGPCRATGSQRPCALPSPRESKHRWYEQSQESVYLPMSDVISAEGSPPRQTVRPRRRR